MSSSRLGSGTGWKGLGSEKPDTPVRVVSQRAPSYPYRLAGQGRIGRVWVTYVVGADGRPYQESFVRPSLGRLLVYHRRGEALRRSRFEPARADGEPVRQRVFQAVKFRR